MRRHQARAALAAAKAVRAANPAWRSRLDAATAHAKLAVTETLRAAPEGRATIALARRGRSYKAALADLLAIPPLLLEAAEAAKVAWYREAYAFWRASLPPDARRASEEPPAALVERARTAIVPAHAQTLLAELRYPVAQAAQGLLRQVVLAGSRGVTPTTPEGRDLIDAWASSAASRVALTFARALADSVAFADRLASRDAADPTLLEPDPALAT